MVWLARLLDGLRLPYAIIGAHAVNAWLEPRFTSDIDVTIELSAEASRDLTAAFEREGFAVVRIHGERLPSGPDFLRFTSRDRLVTIEFQPAKTSFQQHVVQRARRDRNGTCVATPEDLIVLKLIANRPKDQIDLLGLAALDGLDWPYVESAAREWELAEVLAALRARVGR
ncbi:MAG TPA: DUF6036 family nucleotidyltransferase [Myxococcota bacterium]|nr:DUF6036 family nucleotidyltransferase [Myxococcota bacterium]